MKRLRASNVGPVTEADIRFGDLTVFVGPQATGKSIFLQLLKLLVDRPAIHRTMKAFGIGAVLGLVLELRRRGYRICLSTHSPHVLDIVWALKLFQISGGQPSDVLNFWASVRYSAPENLPTTRCKAI